MTFLVFSPLLGNSAAAAATVPRDIASRVGSSTVPFVENRGQIDPRVAYSAQTFAGRVFVTHKGEIVYSLPSKGRGGWSLTETVVGGTARPSAGPRSETAVSYFLGSDPARWRSGLSTFTSVAMGEPWRGVRLSLVAHGNNVEKLFALSPGSSADVIRIAVAGANSLEVDERGALIAHIGPGDVAFTAPVAYQEKNGLRVPIAVSYRIRGREYGFRLGAYDASFPVVIDPLLQSSYLGGSDNDFINDVAIHPTSGQVYAVGVTLSNNFPGTAGGAQPTFGTGTNDAFVARFSATLTAPLLQATYLGGSGGEIGYGIAIHPTSGDVYVAGSTTSTNLPGAAGGAQPALAAAGGDAFVSRLNANLTAIIQSTYVGGTGNDNGYGIAIHPVSGEIYVAGATGSSTFPATAGGAQPALAGNDDAFVTRLSATLTPPILQSTYFGGTSVEETGPNRIAIHPTNGVYITGETQSATLPGLAGGFDTTNAGGFGDGYIARFSAALTAPILQSTFFGGTGEDGPNALDLNLTSGDVYIGGNTGSTDLPNVAGSAFPTPRDSFIARFNFTLTANSQTTYIGGSGGDLVFSLAIHPTSGEVYAAGLTSSTDFPNTAGAAQPANAGGEAMRSSRA